ncbi:hypothetical protein AV955_gp115 [Diadromus pulchellus ascovirus 4a]|uniref:non-specific serine/threonine protein kinase n=1 Tax=Diadromus pulchellus ascovirus 4a TaxID=158683 RepID=F2NZ44_9VIRU|nr:hypothetical protein AV955_gp115 [Diadromus pulchellus ascovirus 4a]CCA61472.1 unnamed protein product [Diadromus pulchellus ascovirus 4a]
MKVNGQFVSVFKTSSSVWFKFNQILEVLNFSPRTFKTHQKKVPEKYILGEFVSEAGLYSLFLGSRKTDLIIEFHETLMDQYEAIFSEATLISEEEMRGPDEWVVGKRIGEGGFGSVYKCHAKSEPRVKYAMKIEKRSPAVDRQNVVISEYYEKLSDVVPVVYDRGDYKQDQTYTVMELLSPIPNFGTAHLNGALKALHMFAKCGLCHGDVKTENMMLKKNKVVMVDFGLSTPIDKPTAKRSGTPIFMSRNAHKGGVSYINDLESLLFVALDVVNDLPWDTEEDDGNQSVILEKKENFIKQLAARDPEIVSRFALEYNPYIFDIVEEVIRCENGGLLPDYPSLIAKVK